jgi:hypothetical protein
LTDHFVNITPFRCDYTVLFGENVPHTPHPDLQEKGGSYAPGLVQGNHAGARPRLAANGHGRSVLLA